MSLFFFLPKNLSPYLIPQIYPTCWRLPREFRLVPAHQVARGLVSRGVVNHLDHARGVGLNRVRRLVQAEKSGAFVALVGLRKATEKG